jgi:hypothetical protein
LRGGAAQVRSFDVPVSITNPTGREKIWFGKLRQRWPPSWALWAGYTRPHVPQTERSQGLLLRSVGLGAKVSLGD